MKLGRQRKSHKGLVGAFNQERALVGAYSAVIAKTDFETPVSGEADLSVLQVNFPNGFTRVEHYLDWIQYETGTGAWIVNINFLESFIKINDSDYILPASIMSVNVLMGLIQHQPQLFPVAKII